MLLTDQIGRAERALRGMRGVELVGEGGSPTARPEDVTLLQERIGHTLPWSLRNIFLHEVGGMRFGWNAPQELFGRECSRGFLHLLNLGEIANTFEDHRSIAADLRQERDLDTDAGVAAVVRDWPHWVPLCRFGAGDYFCLETREGKGDFPVVFLEHDVVGDVPIVHGLRIAHNVEDLFTRWGSLAFVDLWDWSGGVSARGIEPDLPLFRHLRNSLRG